ncbi:MAG: hypothetical protein EDQ89_12935 [Acidobacteria bacterium]|nr:MAG: hypothetical protein EDQ89_12935 [Acidobacteriota bacterium]
MSATAPEPGPEGALAELALLLREEGPLVAGHVATSAEAPALGLLVAAGPRCAGAPSAFATVVELVREGYLCHYREPRLLRGLDPDLRLLLGDHLYARGIERLARLGDLLAVAELADLISIAARLDAAGVEPDAAEIAWLAAVIAIAAGPGAGHDDAKATLRRDGDAGPLWEAASERAGRAGLSERLMVTCKAVGFSPPHRG